MDLLLPNKISGQKGEILREARQVTIIGANGAGKTRFVNHLVEQCGDQAYRISALRALFPVEQEEQSLKGSIGERFDKFNRNMQQVVNTAKSEFDKLTYVMMIDEFRSLMNFKAHQLMHEEMEFPKTKLDKVVKMWQEVFPKNKILRENGKLLFATEGQTDKYTALRLSDGEKAVLYYLGAVLYAMDDAVIFVDDPETFIHPSIMHTLWNVIEEIRPDCTFVYSTHDINFASSRIDNKCIWVKDFNPERMTWDYEVLQSSNNLSDSLYIDLLGTRKPVLFVEGDEEHSIDSRLYALVFPEYTIKPLGSCNKVIESVRSFNDLQGLHHLDSWGIVDRDRRDDKEVAYLRKKKILVPNVAEIENILMLEGVIRAVARHRHKNEHDVFNSVKRAVIKNFDNEIKQQALQHTRHRVKHDIELRVDMKFRNISALEDHMIDLVNEINPRGIYEMLCREFHVYVQKKDYDEVLRVYNQKLMLTQSGVAGLVGLKSREEYIKAVLKILKGNGRDAQDIRVAIKQCFGLEQPMGDNSIEASPVETHESTLSK
ncbi:MAG: DUF4435 domain-containing protein [Muribaculaceae bacterium]|nr:DUF4435 domain-containing protein [Muribaculaceae bacterium]MBQ5408935.1 DUF4435 domain-containing protein [Muribaculaceae bacterium]MDY6413163.1 DUF4435 domain-containing protein [Bacteroidales bacterium]